MFDDVSGYNIKGYVYCLDLVDSNGHIIMNLISMNVFDRPIVNQSIKDTAYFKPIVINNSGVIALETVKNGLAIPNAANTAKVSDTGIKVRLYGHDGDVRVDDAKIIYVNPMGMQCEHLILASNRCNDNFTKEPKRTRSI